eukprot:CAMPEP_0177722400 /NCGR_PEP_ID=MMETSP0484_2-20121128/17660_1 /TAXON_ID=354590 /ORGANISM="Rhodomonas lens, Strain RHODO" /LENGTH=229 /DNA_ID=CAMNT_0019234769 /DNA_START=89 /DNA_END=778 /DNA_ORIENTATION=-
MAPLSCVTLLLLLCNSISTSALSTPSLLSSLSRASVPRLDSGNFRGFCVAEEQPSVDSVSRTIEINATPEECFQIATGYEEYPKWAGSIESVEIVKRRADGLASQVDFKMGMFGINVKNLFQYSYDRPHRMDWIVVRGSVKELIGSYQFHPIGPEQTRVKYDLMVDPGFPMPRPIRQATSRAICNAALSELKRYTELPSTLQRLRKGRVGGRVDGWAATDAVETQLMHM